MGIRFSDESGLPLSDISTTRPTADGNRIFVLKLSFEESRCELLAENGSQVATLNTKTFNQLRTLPETAPVSWDGLVSTQAVTNAYEPSNPQKIAKINLNIYGLLDASDRIALALSRKGLFLQDPDCIRENCCYENPQYLKLPTQEFEHRPGPGYLTEESQQRIEGILSQVQTSHCQESTFTDLGADFEFDHILDQFAQQKGLRQATVNPQIETILLELVSPIKVDGNLLTKTAIRRRA